MGIPEPIYRPGVRLGEIKAATVAAEAGLRQGDVLLRVGDLEVAPSPSSVQDVVAKIRCACTAAVRRLYCGGFAAGGWEIGGRFPARLLAIRTEGHMHAGTDTTPRAAAHHPAGTTPGASCSSRCSGRGSSW